MSLRFDVSAHPGDRAYKLLAGLVVPRPIALVTTVDAAGNINAAPFSFFNVMGAEPPIAVLAPADRDDGTPKDTAANLIANGECPESLRDHRVLSLDMAAVIAGTKYRGQFEERLKAVMNEIAQIFSRMDLSIWDVLAAARTKWNFLPFAPGLVGGHCIGVDPYYLSHRAEQLGLDPRVILSGRGINDGMAGWVAQRLHTARKAKPGSVLVLGLTFKENIPDLRNSKVADLVGALGRMGHAVTVHDPHADADEAMHEYGIPLVADPFRKKYDMVLLAVSHSLYAEMGAGALRALVKKGGTLADLKGALGEAADWRL